jgi:hypothetical protein
MNPPTRVLLVIVLSILAIVVIVTIGNVLADASVPH